jgi:riboflavin kinase/FMN adenylyltransferase
MNIFRNFEEASGIKNPVITTGSFDGVHIGHKMILKRLNNLAKQYDGESVLITFHPHPRRVLYPDIFGKSLKLINTQEEKIELLRKAGIDNVIIIEFTPDFAKTTSEQFVRDYLCEMLRVRVVVVGFNHHFGFNKEGDYKQLWSLRNKFNFEAEEIPTQEVQNEIVSSTKIRQAISEGYIQRANAYLDHYYIIMGKPEKYIGTVAFESIPFVRIPLSEDIKLLPASGIYAVTAAGEAFCSKGMVLINNESLSDVKILVHLFDYDKTVPGKKLIIFFHKMINNSIDFSSRESLNRILKSSIQEIKELIF